ncbi:MAG: energy-coupling factor ABC transporter ATP-binding protein [Bryobacteraceae bacterium]|nr:energy-coupling factor ABC transporter ATP-binding protein [Bryobacteraceae bacterium]
MSCIVDARGLRFSYEPGREVLCGVDFHLHRGESVALFGRNGSGKTTFLLHLNGVLRGEGALRVCDLPVEPKHLPLIRRKIGFLFQDPEDQLFRPTVLEDVAFGPLRAGLPRAEAELRARRALAAVGIEEGLDRAPYHLSSGEKQRVALAGILAVEPEVLILDEPTTHLDPPARRALLELLRTLPQAKLIATHDAAFARALCPRAVFFEHGRIVADGPCTEIIRRFGWDLESPPETSPAPR